MSKRDPSATPKRRPHEIYVEIITALLSVMDADHLSRARVHIDVMADGGKRSGAERELLRSLDAILGAEIVKRQGER